MIDKEVLRNEAIEFLVKRGVVIPNRDEVVELAETVAYDECVAKLGRVDSFEGDDNCGDYGDCGGWDGESNRCDCGNRRVYWEMGYGASFNDMYVIAMAY